MSFVITKTPFRVSFFGGATDYPQWYRLHGGAVLSSTIDKYSYISARYMPDFLGVRHRIVWSHIENVNSISEILHPAVREGLRHYGFDDENGIELHYQGDLPARAGMGSSSAFSVGLIKALKALKGKDIQGIDLARAAIELEQDILNESVGVQDQIAVACGGLNRIEFSKDDVFHVRPVRCTGERRRELEESLLLFFTGTTRLGAEVTRGVISNLEAHADQLHEMRNMVDEAMGILENERPLSAFGTLLDRTWRLKRMLGDKVTTPEIDSLYESALEAGALGGKLLGGGHSGFFLFFVPPERQAAVRQALSGYSEARFRFEDTPCRLIHPVAEGPVGDASEQSAPGRIKLG